MQVYPNSDYNDLSALDHPVFEAIEKEFNDWLDSSNPAMEYEEMYYGDEAIYNKIGAIEGVIEEMINEANETGKPVQLKTFDFAGIFQG